MVPDVTYQGQPVISKLNPELLKAFAEAHEGTFYLANDYSAQQLAETIVNSIKANDHRKQLSGGQEKAFNIVYKEYFQVPLALSLLCLLFALFCPERLGKFWLALILIMPGTISAVDDFTARQNYDIGDYAGATDFYQKLFREKPSAPVQYNLATVYLAEKNYAVAIALLKDLVLSLPDSPLKQKARYNLALAYYLSAEGQTPFWRIYFLKLALNTLNREDNYAFQQAALLFKSELSEALHGYTPLKEHKPDLKELALFYKRGAEDPRLSPFFLSTLVKLQAQAPENKAQGFLEKSQAQLEKEERIQARASLLQALLETEKALNPDPKTPKAKLAQLIDTGEGALDMKRLILEGAKPDDALNQEVLSLAQALPPAIVEWQKKEFEQGKCQCLPWKSVIRSCFRASQSGSKVQMRAPFTPNLT